MIKFYQELVFALHIHFSSLSSNSSGVQWLTNHLVFVLPRKDYRPKQLTWIEPVLVKYLYHMFTGQWKSEESLIIRNPGATTCVSQRRNAETLGGQTPALPSRTPRREPDKAREQRTFAEYSTLTNTQHHVMSSYPISQWPDTRLAAGAGCQETDRIEHIHHNHYHYCHSAEHSIIGNSNYSHMQINLNLECELIEKFSFILRKVKYGVFFCMSMLFWVVAVF